MIKLIQACALFQLMLSQTLFLEEFTSDTFNIVDWNIQPPPTTDSILQTNCQNHQILGGYQIFDQDSIITKLIKLPPHSRIRIVLNFWKINLWWFSDMPIIYADFQIVETQTYFQQFQCQQGLNDADMITFDQTLDHNFNTVLIVVYSEQQAQNNYWGISNFQLYIFNCPPGCIVCDVGDSLTQQCITWTLEQKSLTEMTLSSFDNMDMGWQITNQKQGNSLCSNIPVLCQMDNDLNYCFTDTEVSQSFKLAPHSNIKIHFRFFRIDSWDDNDFLTFSIDNTEQWKGYYHYTLGYKTICGITAWKDLSLNVEIQQKHTDQQIDLKFKSYFYDVVDESFAIRDIYIYINNKCDVNYYFECCGDKIQQIGEECDDGNNVPFDGCHNCQFSCVQGCQNCVNGICLECQEGWIISQASQQCLLIQNNAKIQNQNIVSNSCGLNCSFCYLGLCHQCNYGYSLENNECFSFCGDKLVNKDIFEGQKIEECDNPNSEGCQDCKILAEYECIDQDNSICWTCDEKCQVCVKIDNNLQCNQCQDRYYPKGINCLECDLNCKTCQNESNLCTSCYRSDCLICEVTEGMYTDEKQGKCITICGDGIVVEGYEECDDGNLEDSDGCNSLCQLIPLMEDDLLSLFEVKKSNSLNKNDLNLTKSNSTTIFCSDIVINIEEFLQSEFTLNVTESDGTCLIKFSFFKTIDSFNLIHLNIPYSVDLQRNLYENSKQITIIPEKQIILNENQQAQQIMISEKQSQLYLIILIMAPVSIIFGVFEYYWGVLEMLSWINNFYFLNVNFPFNVENLFLNGDWSSLVNFPTYTDLNQPDAEYYFKSPLKYMAKGVDPLFINNAQVPTGFILFCILLYFISILAYQFVIFLDKRFQKEIYSKRSKKLSIFQIKRRVTISNTQQTISNENDEYEVSNKIVHNNTILSLRKTMLNLKQSLRARINQMISLQIFDITLAVILQILMTQNLQFTIILFNLALAILSIFLIVYQLFLKYRLIYTHKTLLQNQQFQSQYQCLYEGINVDNQFGLVYNFIYLIRKVLYIFFTVYFYDNPLIQTTLCFVTCILGVLLILYQNPFESKRILFFQFIQELSISTVVFITILFALDDQSNCFGEDNKIIQGWVIIAFILLALLTELLVLLYEILKSSCSNLYELFGYCKKLHKKNSKKISKNINDQNDESQDQIYKVANQGGKAKQSNIDDEPEKNIQKQKLKVVVNEGIITTVPFQQK